MKTLMLVVLFLASLCMCEEPIISNDQMIEIPITVFTLKDDRVINARKSKQATDGTWELTQISGITEFIKGSEVKSIKNTTTKIPKPVDKEAARKADAKAYWQGRIEKEKQEAAEKEAIAPFQKIALETSMEANRIKSQLNEKEKKLQLAKTIKRDVPIRINELNASIRSAEIALAKATRETSDILKADLDRLIRARAEQEQMLAFAVDAQPGLEQEVSTLAKEFEVAQKYADEAREKLTTEEETLKAKKVNPFK